MFLKPIKTVGDTVTVSATSTNSQFTVPENAEQLLVQNAGPNTVFIRFGKSAQTADTTKDLPILSGVSRVITKDSMTNGAAICASTQTATLYLTPVMGM